MTASDKKTDDLVAAVSRLKNPTRHTGFRLTTSGDTRQEFPVKQARDGKESNEELLDFDGTIIPEIKGSAAQYLKALKQLTAEDLSPLAKSHAGKGRVIDIVTARPKMFHSAMRETATRLGLDVGKIHYGGFDKTEKIRELGRPLVDNNAEVVEKIHKNLGSEWARLISTHTKQADSWLERWLALHAARDAANMTNPQGDAIAGKLGGPLSLGLSEAISNKLSLGDTKAERRETLRDAVDDVEDSTYRQALVSGLKSSLPYALAGGAGGLVTSAYKMTTPGVPDIGGRDIAKNVGVGAGIGIGASVLRSLLQKAILDSVSNKAKRKAIAIKADMPMTTSLPFGDAIAAAIHPISKQANSRRPRNPRQTFQTKSLPVAKEQPAAKSEARSPSVQKPSLLDLYKKEPTLKLPTPSEVEPASNLLTRVLESDIAKKIGDRLSLSGGLRLGTGSEIQFRPSSISLTHRF